MVGGMIPFEIQEEIIKRVLPVKCLIRFRSVSKEWKSLIDSSEFTTHHSINQAQPRHLLVSYTEIDNAEVKYVSISDDDSFPQHKCCSAAISPSVKLVNSVFMLGCSHGLVCLGGCTPDPVNRVFVVWNPSIRKSVGIVLPSGSGICVFVFGFGFGVCPKTNDPKIVQIPRFIGGYEEAEAMAMAEAKAMVFSLSSGRGWRTIPMNLSRKLIIFPHSPVVIGGVMHWVAHDDFKPTDDVHFRRIISFDLTSEEFGEVDLPDSLARLDRSRSLAISKLKESLVVLDYYYSTGDAGKPACDVWMMLKNGAKNISFTKLFSVNARPGSIIGFSKNGLPIMYQPYRHYGELEVCEPGSEHMNGLGIYGCDFFNVASYTESLFLLNHSDSIIQ